MLLISLDAVSYAAADSDSSQLASRTHPLTWKETDTLQAALRILLINKIWLGSQDKVNFTEERGIGLFSVSCKVSVKIPVYKSGEMNFFLRRNDPALD